jgi:hypothetical protein
MAHTRTQSRSDPNLPAAIVLFGIDANGEPKAARFRKAEASLATKAAAQLQLHVLKVADAEVSALAAKLPPGRIHASGRGVVHSIKPDLYTKLVAAAGSTAATNSPSSPVPPNAGSNGGPPSGAKKGSDNRLPASWDEIAVGHAVIAHDSADGGWVDAIVVERSGDMCTLKWRDYPRDRRFTRHYRTLALLCPSPPDLSAPKPGGKSGKQAGPKGAETKSAAPGLPLSWDEIGVGQLVLALQDGPWGVWWEAVAEQIQGDTITLRWRDYADLPLVNRPRASLALMCPTAP